MRLNVACHGRCDISPIMGGRFVLYRKMSLDIFSYDGDAMKQYDIFSYHVWYLLSQRVKAWVD